MSDPTGGGWQARKAKRQEAMKRAHANVNAINEELSTAREVYSDKDPRVKKLQADSVAAVGARKKAIKDLQEGI